MKRTKGFLTLCLVISLVMALTQNLWAQEVKKININKASAAELTELKRIGPKIAQRIIDYREKHGSFEMPEEIIKVKGIGPKTFELNKDRITVK